MSTSTSMSMAASISGIASVIYSVGGSATPLAAATQPEVKVQGTATPSTTPSYVQSSDARSSFASSLVAWMLAATFLFVFMVRL